MCQHAATGRHQRCSVLTHGLVGGYIFYIHSLRLLYQGPLNLRNAEALHSIELSPHAFDGPEQIDRRWPRAANHLAYFVEFLAQGGMITGHALLRSERYSHGSSHSDGGSPAHNHGANRVGHLLVAAAGDVDLFGGQLGLVNKAHPHLGPFQGLNHESSILEHFSKLSWFHLNRFEGSGMKDKHASSIIVTQ